MKRINYILIAFAVSTMFAACQKEMEEVPVDKTGISENNLVSKTFTAVFEETKALMNGVSVEFVAGDRIAIFDNVNPEVAHEFVANGSGNNISFTGEVSATATKFYAIYPYSAAVSCNPSDGVNGTIQVEIPQNQVATEGSFDPAAFVAMGFSTSSEDKLRFRNALSLLKFQVSRDDIKSVTLSSGKNMSGSLQINVTAAGGIGTGDGTGTKLKSVTIQPASGCFQKGVDYYAAVRYRTGTNAYTDFKAELVTSEGGIGSKTASSALSIERSHIQSIGSFSDVTFVKSLYASYQAGNDVEIAGRTYNKATDGDATLLADGGNFKTGTTGVIFIDSDATVSNSSEVTITGDVVLTSNDPDHPGTYKMTSGKSFVLQSGSLVLDKLIVDMSPATSGQFMTKKDNDGNFSALTIYQCDFKSITRPVYTPNSGYLLNGIESVLINGNRFATGADVQLFQSNSGVTTLAGYKDFTFTNNVLYSTTGEPQQTYVFNTSSTAANEANSQQELVMDNNLFYNIAASNGIFRTYYVKSAYIRNNILWAKDGTYSSNIKMFRVNLATATATTVFTGESSNNYGFGDLGGKSWSIADAAYRGPLANVKTAETNPIASFNASTGEFELVDAYKSYGPQLQPAW